MAINGYWVISIFEVSECYLISPDQHIFQKLPKMSFLNNVLIFFWVVLLNRISRKDQNWWNGPLWGDRCHKNSQILQFLKLYYETTIPKVYFDQIFFFKNQSWINPVFIWDLPIWHTVYSLDIDGLEVAILLYSDVFFW